MAAFDDVAGYMATVPETHRPALETLYQQIKKLYPDVTEIFAGASRSSS